MKIINNGDFGGCNKRIIVGSEAEKPNGIQDFEAAMFETFLKGEKDVASTTDFDAITVFVKYEDDAEKMRVRGAKARAELGKDAETIAVLGTKDSCFDLIEGLLLSNYQFNKYFKDREKKDNKLNEITVET